MGSKGPYDTIVVSPKGHHATTTEVEIHSRHKAGKKTRARSAKIQADKRSVIERRRKAQEGTQRFAFTEPSIFAYRAMSTGRRRHSERAAPGLGPGPAGGIRER